MNSQKSQLNTKEAVKFQLEYHFTNTLMGVMFYSPNSKGKGLHQEGSIFKGKQAKKAKDEKWVYICGPNLVIIIKLGNRWSTTCNNKRTRLSSRWKPHSQGFKTAACSVLAIIWRLSVLMRSDASRPAFHKGWTEGWSFDLLTFLFVYLG